VFVAVVVDSFCCLLETDGIDRCFDLTFSGLLSKLAFSVLWIDLLGGRNAIELGYNTNARLALLTMWLIMLGISV